jgi:hypothetical protein
LNLPTSPCVARKKIAKKTRGIETRCIIPNSANKSVGYNAHPTFIDDVASHETIRGIDTDRIAYRAEFFPRYLIVIGKVRRCSVLHCAIVMFPTRSLPTARVRGINYRAGRRRVRRFSFRPDVGRRSFERAILNASPERGK